MVVHTSPVTLFERVRDLPYDTTSAYDGEGLRAQGRGNCVAKAALLAEELGALGLPCRTVSWEYELPLLVDVQQRLGFRADIRTAVQVHVGGRWVLVDATHDPRLGTLGLTVGRWDGRSATEPAYQPIGPCVVLGQDGPGSAQLQEASERIERLVEATRPELITQYRDELNALFESCRQGRDPLPMPEGEGPSPEAPSRPTARGGGRARAPSRPRW